MPVPAWLNSGELRGQQNQGRLVGRTGGDGYRTALPGQMANRVMEGAASPEEYYLAVKLLGMGHMTPPPPPPPSHAPHRVRAEAVTTGTVETPHAPVSLRSSSSKSISSVGGSRLGPGLTSWGISPRIDGLIGPAISRFVEEIELSPPPGRSQRGRRVRK